MSGHSEDDLHGREVALQRGEPCIWIKASSGLISLGIPTSFAGDTRMALGGPRPTWLTFDCYGTLIQWDEGLMAAMETILSRKGRRIEAQTFIPVYDRHEHQLEHTRPHLSFAEVTAKA